MALHHQYIWSVSQSSAVLGMWAEGNKKGEFNHPFNPIYSEKNSSFKNVERPLDGPTQVEDVDETQHQFSPSSSTNGDPYEDNNSNERTGSLDLGPDTFSPSPIQSADIEIASDRLSDTASKVNGVCRKTIFRKEV
uniref:Uncharacterized protein n=1 Tax=Ditylenchus dipsaci TaxID=166011 RepID=A0A915ELQ1_9BILA